MKLSVICALLLSASPVLVHAQKDCSKIFDRTFQRISNDKLVAFEVNSGFYLKAEFKKNCKLVRIDVAPKNFSPHLNPEWKEVDFGLGLAEEEYTQLLTRINGIKPLGRLVHKGTVCPVTNSTCWMRDDYANAYILRGLRPSPGGSESSKTRTFEIHFGKFVPRSTPGVTMLTRL